MAGPKESYLNGMPSLVGDVTNPQAKQVLEQHRQEARQQRQRLEQIFRQMGETSNDIQPEGIKGILAENSKTKSQCYDPATHAKQLNDTWAA